MRRCRSRGIVIEAQCGVGVVPRSRSAVNRTVASKAGRMQPHGNGIGEIRRTMTATGLHPTMTVRYEPAERVLHNGKGHNRLVKRFRGGSIVYLSGHDVP
jgi:hypothetical protein